MTIDYKLGDFTDKNTGTDYGYDKNGNLITDLNKGIKGVTNVDQTSGGAISYNHLNLPYQILVKDENNANKGRITYVYDAAGNKLQKQVLEFACATNNNQEKTVITTYSSGFVYGAILQRQYAIIPACK